MYNIYVCVGGWVGGFVCLTHTHIYIYIYIYINLIPSNGSGICRHFDTIDSVSPSITSSKRGSGNIIGEGVVKS